MSVLSHSGAAQAVDSLHRMDNRSYYDQFSAWYERERHGGYHLFIDQLTIDLVRRYLSPGMDILEAGCGTGLILSRLAPFVKSSVGLDLSSGMLEKAKARGLCVVHGSVTELPFADESFDLVCSFKVLAHVEQIEQAMRELSRVLRPGGRMLVEFYNTTSLRYLIRRLKTPGKISQNTDEDSVYTRYDTLGQIESYLPREIRVEGVHGIRVVTPLPQSHRWPIVGPALQAMERAAADLPVLRRLGGFLLVVARKS